MRGRALGTPGPNSMAASEASSDEEDPRHSPRVEKPPSIYLNKRASSSGSSTKEGAKSSEKRSSKEVPTVV